jgi:hypothetical protein
MQELELTWSRVLKIWWLLIWRGQLIAILIGFLLGFVWGVVVSSIGRADLAETGGTAIGAAVGLVWGMFAVRMALRKQYADFRLALVARTSN